MSDCEKRGTSSVSVVGNSVGPLLGVRNVLFLG